MSKHRSVRFAKLLFALAIAVVGFIAAEMLTSGITPTTQAVCPHGNCPPGPTDDVYCSNHHVYSDICAANADCQYNCCTIGIDPDCPDPR